MKITPAILAALQHAVDKAGNPSRFAAQLNGIKQTTVRNWLLGITKNISDENWHQVEALITFESGRPLYGLMDVFQTYMLLDGQMDAMQNDAAKKGINLDDLFNDRKYSDLLDDLVFVKDILFSIIQDYLFEVDCMDLKKIVDVLMRCKTITLKNPLQPIESMKDCLQRHREARE